MYSGYPHPVNKEYLTWSLRVLIGVFLAKEFGVCLYLFFIVRIAERQLSLLRLLKILLKLLKKNLQMYGQKKAQNIFYLQRLNALIVAEKTLSKKKISWMFGLTRVLLIEQL